MVAALAGVNCGWEGRGRQSHLRRCDRGHETGGLKSLGNAERAESQQEERGMVGNPTGGPFPHR